MVRRLRGTPEERRALKEQRRIANRAAWVRDRARAVRGGHQRVIVACNAALAASRRLDDGARSRLAREIAEIVERIEGETR